MFLSTATYQRTQAGREEIYRKQAGLTQSERLVLIMVDGITSCQDVRAKLSSLKDERFERAMHMLLKKDLITEVFLSVEGQEPEQIETEVVDRFLHQDPADPVTIISYHPEEDFDEFLLQKKSEVSAKPASSIPELDVVVAPVPAVDEVHAKMADSLQQEMQALSAERRQRLEQAPKVIHEHEPVHVLKPRQDLQPQAQSQPQPQPQQTQHSNERGGVGFHWGYWMIGLGLSFIIGFFLVKLTNH